MIIYDNQYDLKLHKMFNVYLKMQGKFDMIEVNQIYIIWIKTAQRYKIENSLKTFEKIRSIKNLTFLRNHRLKFI